MPTVDGVPRVALRGPTGAQEVGQQVSFLRSANSLIALWAKNKLLSAAEQTLMSLNFADYYPKVMRCENIH